LISDRFNPFRTLLTGVVSDFGRENNTRNAAQGVSLPGDMP
jgi:hypothetical protein